MEKSQLYTISRFAVSIRMETFKMIASLGVGHIGGALSIADVLAVLYGGVMRIDPADPKKEDRDWLVCSKGHAGPAVYAALALKGYFDMALLETLNRPGTQLPSHCDMNRTPGVDMTTGSLGQGASLAAGVALGHRIRGKNCYTYLILGDGESQEGQVWEAALFAGQRGLSQLIGFTDNNRLQIDGPTDDICALGDIAAKYREFGWFSQTVDGHDVGAIAAAVERAKGQKEKPSMIVLNTIKGFGSSLTAGRVESHSMEINAEQLARALEELQAEYDRMED